MTVELNLGITGTGITGINVFESETIGGTYTAISGQSNINPSSFPLLVSSVNDDSRYIKLTTEGSCTEEQIIEITGVPLSPNSFVNSSPEGIISFVGGVRTNGLKIQGIGGIYEFRVNGSIGSWSQTINVDQNDPGTAYKWRCRQTSTTELVNLGLNITQIGGLNIDVTYQTPSNHTGIENTSTAFKYYLNVCSGQSTDSIIMRLDQTKAAGQCDGITGTGNTYKIAPDSYILISLA
jgi:hypothetical protein